MEGVATREAIDTVDEARHESSDGAAGARRPDRARYCLAILEVLHHGLGEPKYRPCPLLRKYVAAGWLGRKSGRGFYEYA